MVTLIIRFNEIKNCQVINYLAEFYFVELAPVYISAKTKDEGFKTRTEYVERIASKPYDRKIIDNRTLVRILRGTHDWDFVKDVQIII